MDPRRFAEGFSKTPWTHPWGLSHKIPLVRVSKSLLRSDLVAASTSIFSRRVRRSWEECHRLGLLGPGRMSVQQASQEGPCEAVPTDGFTTFAEHSSCAARELAYEAAVRFAVHARIHYTGTHYVRLIIQRYIRFARQPKRLAYHRP